MSKLARAVLDTISAFPPNRDTLGATAYLIVENQTNFLIDCPAWDNENQQFLQERGGVSWLIVTHRGGIGKVKEIQAAFGCQVLIQEQEAYFLPDLEVKTFEHEFNLSPQTQVIWTPGHSPGSSCVYSNVQGGVLFSGRHLVPNQQGLPVPLRTSKTFHWWRQLRSVALLRDRFSPNTLNYLCPGANTGFLRGKRIIEQAYEHLAALDLDAMRETQPQF